MPEARGDAPQGKGEQREPLPLRLALGHVHGKYPEMGERKGRFCRVLPRGAKNTALVKFAGIKTGRAAGCE